MGLINMLDKFFLGKEFLNRCKNDDSEYMHPNHRESLEANKLYRIQFNQQNQYNIQISKMLEEIEKKSSISKNKNGSIVALESLPEIIREEIVKCTRLPLNRLKEYWHSVDHDYSLYGDERLFKLAEIEEYPSKSPGSFAHSFWRCNYLENEEGKPFLRIKQVNY